ncbi:MAG TPA: MFS transporter [Stellaceae bacterium]|jgi:MFS family permease|nr:MFS transporter [Stellaceae bacterium]
MNSHSTARAAWPMIAAACAILLITMGARQTIGLFIAPLDAATGLGIVAISLAVAVGQFVWGLAQPVFGGFADRYGAGRVIAFGGVMLALGTAATPFVHSEWALVATLGVVSAFGAGAGSLSILIGSVMQRLPGERRSMAAGIINAGGSVGQFVFAPTVQAAIFAIGWVGAMVGVAAATLLTLPLALAMRRRGASHAGVAAASAAPALTLRQQLRAAAAERSYWWLHLGFFTCGFHVAFLVTHLPGEVRLCGLSAVISANSIAIIGLANVAGSLGAGWLGTRFRMKFLLSWIYAARAMAILCFLAAPKTATNFYIFAAALGVTWLATLPPTAGLVGKLFGTRYLATLIGLTMLSHQLGAFYGAWLGGLAVAHFGNYTGMFLADAALAAFAALVNLPIREAPVMRAAAAA